MIRSPRSRVAPIAASIVAVLALGLAACGGDDDDADTTTPVADVTSADVTSDVTSADVTSPDETSPDETAATVTVGSAGGSSTPGSGSAAGEVGTEEEYVQAIADVIAFEDAETGQCVAGALVDAVGYDQITEAGITVEQFGSGSAASNGLTFDEDSTDDVASEVSACGDVLDQLVTSTGMDDDDRACVEDNLDNDQLAELLVSDFFGVEPSDEVATGSDAVSACISGATETTVAD